MIASLSDESFEAFDVIYPVFVCEVVPSRQKNGARHDDIGCLEVDAHQRTDVPGIIRQSKTLFPTFTRSRLQQVSFRRGHRHPQQLAAQSR